MPSRNPQAYFPQLCITAIVVPGLAIGDTGEDRERFIANQRIAGPLPEMLETAVDFVRRNGRTKIIIDDAGRRNDKTEFPAKAVREAILNALIHRDYSTHTESVPIRIVMYSDRMEIINSGGLYGNIAIDSLGKVRPDTRNPTLTNIMEQLSIAENRYSGIPTIRKEFTKADLPEPVFATRHGEFVVTFKSDFLILRDGGLKKDMSTPLLEYCKVPRTREELVAFTGFSQYYTMAKLVQPLIDNGKIQLSIPDKPRTRSQRYVTGICSAMTF
jgi:ATP-dependent DNA helicase RecG